MARISYDGTNVNRMFRKAARVISGKIATIEGVIGIVAVGGVARGYSDEYSDLDLIVYADRTAVRSIATYIAVGFLAHKGVSFDTPVESYQAVRRRRVPSDYWCQELRWTLAEGDIMYDTGGRIAELIAEKVVFPEYERKRLMDEHFHEVDEILNYLYPTWQLRGDVHHLGYLMRLATEHIIRWCYARNQCFRPYMTKWPFYYLENGLIPEAKHMKMFTKAFTAGITTNRQADRMRGDLFRLCRLIEMDIEPVDIHQVMARMPDNWAMASEKTRYYLSW